MMTFRKFFTFYFRFQQDNISLSQWKKIKYGMDGRGWKIVCAKLTPVKSNKVKSTISFFSPQITRGDKSHFAFSFPSFPSLLYRWATQITKSSSLYCSI